VAVLGRRWVGWNGEHSGLADCPQAAVLAGTSPALLQSLTSARGGRGHWSGPPARSPAGGSTSTTPTTSGAGGGCGHPRDRVVDHRDAGPAWSGPQRTSFPPVIWPVEVRRPGAWGRRSAGVRRGGRGPPLLRALRGVGRAGGEPRDGDLSSPGGTGRARRFLSSRRCCSGGSAGPARAGRPRAGRQVAVGRARAHPQTGRYVADRQRFALAGEGGQDEQAQEQRARQPGFSARAS